MRLLVAAVLLLVVPSDALPQTMPPVPAERSDAQRGMSAAAAPANMTFATIPGSAATPGQAATSAQVILDASVKDKVGTAAFGWKSGKTLFQLSFSAPVGATDEATPLSLTGLSTGAKAKLSWNQVFWRSPNPVEQQALVALCQRLGLGIPVTSSGTFTDEDFEKAKKLPECSTATIQNPTDRAMYEHLSHLRAHLWLFGFDVAAGKASRNFVHDGSLEPDADNRPEWSVAGRAGIFQQNIGFFIAGISKAHSFSTVPPAQICRPMAGVTLEGGATRCESLVVGAPVPKNTSVFTTELRRLVSNKFAMSPSVTIGLRKADGKRHWGAELPIYFLTTSGVPSPTGGVRLSYRSDTQEVTAVIFIGGAFKLLG